MQIFVDHAVELVGDHYACKSTWGFEIRSSAFLAYPHHGIQRLWTIGYSTTAGVVCGLALVNPRPRTAASGNVGASAWAVVGQNATEQEQDDQREYYHGE